MALATNPCVHDDLLKVDVPTSQLLARMIHGGVLSRTIYTACKLGLTDLCADQPRTADELAAATGADADVLDRYLRVLATARVFEEDADGCFHLGATGELLRRDVPGSMWSLAILGAELLEPTPAGALYSARTGRPAFDHAHGCSLYEHLAADPDDDALFAATMTARAARLHAAVIDAVDWIGVRHIIDVGGNQGAFLAAVLTHLTDATGVLFDQPHVVAGASGALAAAGVADRVDVTGGDFFRAVPPGGDLYLIANVLWNWSDERAGQILRQCRTAMASAARLIICEPVMPDDNRPHPSRACDVINLWMSGGRARRLEEWRALLAGAGFDLVQVAETAVEWSVLEASPR